MDIPSDGRRHYGVHVERAVANAERALSFAGSDGAARRPAQVAVCVTVAQVGGAVVDALLAIADRLDVMIGAGFDEGRAVHVVTHDGGPASELEGREQDV